MAGRHALDMEIGVRIPVPEFLSVGVKIQVQQPTRITPCQSDMINYIRLYQISKPPHHGFTPMAFWLTLRVFLPFIPAFTGGAFWCGGKGPQCG